MMADFVYLVELEKHESARTDRVPTVERKNTKRNCITFGDVQQPIQLHLHYVWIAESPIQDRFVENGRKLERIISSQNLLSGESSLDSPPGLARRYGSDVLHHAFGHCAGVVSRLQ